MKKLSLLLLMLTLSFGAIAQGNVASVQSKIDKSNSDLQNPSKAKKVANWIKNANLYVDMADVNLGQFFAGLEAQQAVIMFGKPLNAEAPEVVEINGQAYTKYQYPAVDAYFDANNQLKMYVETKTPMPDALEKAIESLKKAYEIDPSKTEDITAVYGRICKAYIAIADNNYNLQNFDVAAENFYKVGKLGVEPIVGLEGIEDLLYFSVVAYAAENNFEDAKPALDILIERDYLKDGDILYYQGLIENGLGNTKAAEEAYLKGVKLYPENSKILSSLIAFYITNNEEPSKVIPFIKAAQEKDPTNAILYMAEGLAYGSMKDYKNSVIAYEKAAEIDANNFDIAYNLGLTYYRISESYNSELGSINYNDTAAYDAKLKEIDAAQMKSLDALLKAEALNPTEPNTIELIRSIYFRQRNKSDEMMQLYTKYDEKSKANK